MKVGYELFGIPLKLFNAECEVGSGSIYLKNRGDGLDFAASVKISAGPTCDFGLLSKILKFGSEMSIYTHWLSEGSYLNTPRLILRGEGDVKLDILKYIFRFGSLRFVHDFDIGTMHISGDLDPQFTKVPVFQLAGSLGPDGGALKSTFDFTIDLLWGAILSWYGNVEISVLKDSEPSLKMEGSFKLGSFTTYAIASVRILDGRVVFALCNNDLPRFGNEILAVLDDSPGPDNCLDLNLLFNGIQNGGTCATSKMCATGRCDLKKNQGFGSCVERLADGERCNENTDCISNRCKFDRLTLTRPGTCQPLGNVGDSCADDEDCASQRCEGALSGSCQDRLVDGSQCDEHSDCVSNHCTVALNRKCAPLLATGQQCSGNRVCRSGSCSFCGLCREIRKCD